MDNLVSCAHNLILPVEDLLVATPVFEAEQDNPFFNLEALIGQKSIIVTGNAENRYRILVGSSNKLIFSGQFAKNLDSKSNEHAIVFMDGYHKYVWKICFKDECKRKLFKRKEKRYFHIVDARGQVLGVITLSEDTIHSSAEIRILEKDDSFYIDSWRKPEVKIKGDDETIVATVNVHSELNVQAFLGIDSDDSKYILELNNETDELTLLLFISFVIINDAVSHEFKWTSCNTFSIIALFIVIFFWIVITFVQ